MGDFTEWSKWFDLNPRRYNLAGVLRNSVLRKGRRFQIQELFDIDLLGTGNISDDAYFVIDEWEIVYGRRSKGETKRPVKGYRRRSSRRRFKSRERAEAFIAKEVN